MPVQEEPIPADNRKGLPVGMAMADQSFLHLPRAVRKRFNELLEASQKAGIAPIHLLAFCTYALTGGKKREPYTIEQLECPTQK